MRYNRHVALRARSVENARLCCAYRTVHGSTASMIHTGKRTSSHTCDGRGWCATSTHGTSKRCIASSRKMQPFTSFTGAWHVLPERPRWPGQLLVLESLWMYAAGAVTWFAPASVVYAVLVTLATGPLVMVTYRGHGRARRVFTKFVHGVSILAAYGVARIAMAAGQCPDAARIAAAMTKDAWSWWW